MNIRLIAIFGVAAIEYTVLPNVLPVVLLAPFTLFLISLYACRGHMRLWQYLLLLGVFQFGLLWTFTELLVLSVIVFVGVLLKDRGLQQLKVRKLGVLIMFSGAATIGLTGFIRYPVQAILSLAMYTLLLSVFAYILKSHHTGNDYV